MKVLFIASDNSYTSGAFLSMTYLNAKLNSDFNVETLVILPREGTGGKLLDEWNVKHKTIKSYDWVIQKDTSHSIKFKIKYSIKKISNYFAASKIAKIAKEGGYDIIHINTIYSYVGAIAARKAKIPYVWHLREILEEGQNRRLMNPKKSYKLISKASRILTISRSVYSKYCYHVDCRRLRVVYNGIDSDIFYRPNKEIFQNEKTIINFVGGFNKNKGAYTICDALINTIKKGYNDISIWFIGEPTDKFVDYVEKIGLTKYSKFWGYQKNVVDFYEKADITLTGGKMEAFGRTTAEAQMAGDLVIATNSAGSKELVIDRVTGLSYKFGNAEQLTEKIIYALEHKDEMRKIAKAGQAFINDKMSAYINAKNVYMNYKEILNV